MALTTAEVLLEELWDQKVPIDPEDFACALGLNVKKVESLGIKASCFDAQTKTITVTESVCRETQRFAIAREIGHYCLGHGSSVRDLSKPDWFKAKPEQEHAADRFAEEILMPRIALEYLIRVLGERDPAVLRKRFGVSAMALYSRLKSVGYFA